MIYMVSLLVNSYCNTIITEGNLNNINSNIKKLLQLLIENKIYLLNSVLSLRNNLFFKEKNVDILSAFHNTKQYKEVLENRGYVQTTAENFVYENVNGIISKRSIPFFVKENDPFVYSVALNNHGIKNDYGFFVEQNYVLFHSLNSSKVDFYYNLNENYKLKDFKIDSNNFVFIIYEYDHNTYLAISHLGLNFINLNRDQQEINEEYLFNKIKIDDNITEILYTDYNNYYFLTSENTNLEYVFNKRYYFEDDQKYYFFADETIDPYKDQIIDVKQAEFLNIYNYINMLGLNDFKIDGQLKISSQDDNIVNQLLSNKFDNTLNGGINFFNAKIYGLNKSNMDGGNKLPDYRVFINDEYFNIYGNFVYDEYQKGDFQIKVTSDSVSLYDSNNLCLKSCKIPSFKEFYFCNLKFTFKKYEFPINNYTFKISCHDSYPFLQRQINNFKLKDIPNKSSISTNLINSAKIDNIDNRIVNGEFDGRKIVFYNYFDHHLKKFKYSNKTIDFVPNSKIHKSEINQYYCEQSIVDKNNFIYFRDYGKFYYTNVDNLSFELINKNGYITDFWINNQDKVLYFKNTEDNIMITNNNKDADYYCYIPPIKYFIEENNECYYDVELEENDDLEIEREYSDNLLMTDKFFNKPLFYKFFIDNVNDLSKFTLYDEDENEISEYISEVFQNGIVIYFDKKKNKKYYYNLDDNQYNYINPIKSYENIEITHYFDENGTIKLEPKLIKSFYLKGTTNKDSISLFLYNTIQGETHRLSLSKDELNKRFELDLSINKIQIDDSDISFSNLSFVEDSANSIKFNNTITYFKEKRDSIVYISSINKDIDIHTMKFSVLKVDTDYNTSNGKLIETNNGPIRINRPLSDEISLFYCDKFSYYESPLFVTYSIYNDEYYNNNFRNVGSFHIYGDNVYKKLSETNNEIFEINKTIKGAEN